MPLDFAKIKMLREKAGLSLQDAADKAGFKNRQQWHQIESGARLNIELGTLEAVANALGCKAKDLLK